MFSSHGRTELFQHVLTVFGLVALLSLLASWPATAQTQPSSDTAVSATSAGDTVEVVLQDGSRYYGRILSETDAVIRIELLSGSILEVRREQVRSAERFRGRVVSGTVWRRDPNATRLFFAPTARSLSAGRGYVSVYELFMPFVAVGIHDRVTLAAGTPLVFSSQQSERLLWFAPKVQLFQRPNTAAAMGVLHFWLAGRDSYCPAGDPYCEEDPAHYGVAYAVMTLGSEDEAVTFGGGAAYSGMELVQDPLVFMAGGEMRTSKGLKLITENYFFPGGNFFILSGGMRFFGEKLTADLGLFAPLGEGMDGLVALPLVNFVYNW